MYSEEKWEQHRPASSTNSLTATATPLCSVRTLPPSIARAASMYFMEETMPIRLCYRGSSFVNSSSYQGRLKESTQMGVELLNDDSAMADAEIIAMTVKVMLDAGLTDFQISIGHVGFFQALAEEAALAEDVLNELKELISIKNHLAAEELLAKTEPSK